MSHVFGKPSTRAFKKRCDKQAFYDNQKKWVATITIKGAIKKNLSPSNTTPLSNGD